jgi:hypothetical protein
MEPKVNDTPSPETSAQSDAARAIALCRMGAVGDGIALYRKVLKSEVAWLLPVGLHLKMLQSFGLHDAADTIRRSALAAGANTCISAVMGRSPAVIVDEYRALFAQGLINATMVSSFLVALSKLGVRDELAALLDPNRLFCMAQVTVGESAASHWKSLERVLLEAEVDDTWQEAVQSVRKMHNINLNLHADRLVQMTLAEIDRRAAHYLANWTKSDHVLSRWVPRTFGVSHWAMISHGDGYNVPHTHPKGWITGVLYVAGPDRADAGEGSPGALRIGPPSDVVDSAGWPDITVAPAPGTLVLMPSYYTHWTVPLGRPGLRIAIAFDVIDLRDDHDQEAPAFRQLREQIDGRISKRDTQKERHRLSGSVAFDEGRRRSR